MESDNLLSIITVCGLVLGAIGAVLSQTRTASVDVPNSHRRKLTPAGWLLLSIALAGAFGAIGSELLRIKFREEEKRQTELKKLADVAAAERKALEQRQALIENSIRQTGEIIIAGQPLTSMSFRMVLSTSDQTLVKALAEGRKKIEENEIDVQGGVPRTPFEVADYDYQLIPLLDYLGTAGRDGTESANPYRASLSNTVALLRLSTNAILSFGRLSPRPVWLGRKGKSTISAGFIAEKTELRERFSSPYVERTGDGAGGSAKVAVRWALDPVTLWNSIDRQIAEIPTSALIPKTLQMAIWHRSSALPFARNDFARVQGASDFWTSTGRETTIPWPDPRSDIALEIQVNNAHSLRYALKRRYLAKVYADSGEELEDAALTMLEFQQRD